MTNGLWAIIFVQVAMGGFDTLYHHELTERLAWRPRQRRELELHGIRNLAYAVMFMALGWGELHGAAALGLMALMIGELGITVWDFVEEDRTRKLPETERVVHTLLTLNYGIVLAMLSPLLFRWGAMPTTIVPSYYGIWSWLCLIAATGVVFSAALLRSRSREALLGALLFPIVIPVLLAASRATACLFDPLAPDLEPVSFWTRFLLATDVIYIALGLWVFEPVVSGD